MEVFSSNNTGEKPTKNTWFRRIFYGPHGLRAIWGVLLFIVTYVVLDWALDSGLDSIPSLSMKEPISPMIALIRQFFELAVVFFTMWILSKIEGRSIATYGFNGQLERKRIVIGATFGFLYLSLLIFILCECGYFAIDGFSKNIANILLNGCTWALTCLMIGVLEESIFRGYLQHTLTRAVGFWPAALLVSGGFILWHVANNGESVFGLLITGVGSIVFSLSLYYTKSLWWAIGFHAGWDWGQSYFYGTPDSGVVTKGHFLHTHPFGKAIFSGGAVGPEGSVFLLFLLLLLLPGMWLWWSGRFNFKKQADLINE